MSARPPHHYVVFAFLLLMCPLIVFGHDKYTVLSKAKIISVQPSRILSAPENRVVFDSVPFSAGSAIPHWEKGYLISITSEATQPNTPDVRLYDASGRKVREAAIWFEGARDLFVLSAAVARGGTILASGTAVNSDGNRAYFIAMAGATGTVTAAIQTNPLLAKQICAAPDGTVWAFGGLERNLGGPRPQGDLLRHFDFQKGLIGSLLPSSGFDPKLGRPDLETGRAGEEVYMRCSDTMLGIYSGPVNEYIALNLVTGALRQFAVRKTNVGIGLAGFALTDGGEAYGVLVDRAARKEGLFHLDIDQSANRANWTPVNGSIGQMGQPGIVSQLWGADANRLVYGMGEPSEKAILYWSEAP
jgi:hypothetical protein